MSVFRVIGGKKLSGEIVPQGAKNEALQIISAVLLTPEKVTITNIETGNVFEGGQLNPELIALSFSD